MTGWFILLGSIPVLVLGVFLIHWRIIAPIKNPVKRLSQSRIPYLCLSFVMLVSAWVLFFLCESGLPLGIFIPFGVTFAFIGDYFNLQFPLAQRLTGNKSVFGGIIAFCVTQVCYMVAFMQRIDISILIVSGVFMPLVIVMLLLPCAVFILRIYHPSLSCCMVVGSLFYGCLLGLMTAFSLCGALLNGGSWFMIAAGAVLFMLSDARMGETTIHGRHPPSEFQVPWITYLAAQALILYGFALQSV